MYRSLGPPQLTRRAGSGHQVVQPLNNILAVREAQAKGSLEALLLNASGQLAEGASSNLFVVNDGRLLTPPLSRGDPGGNHPGARARPGRQSIGFDAQRDPADGRRPLERRRGVPHEQPEGSDAGPRASTARPSATAGPGRSRGGSTRTTGTTRTTTADNGGGSIAVLHPTLSNQRVTSSFGTRTIVGRPCGHRVGCAVRREGLDDGPHRRSRERFAGASGRVARQRGRESLLRPA